MCYTLGIGYDSITQIVLPYAIYWKEIGILLDVDSKQLERLEQTCPNDFIRCCKEMINKWLQSDRNASQNKLIASIKLATVTSPQISLPHKIQGRMEGGFLGFQETPFDCKTISKITYLNKYTIINILASYVYLSANTI